MIHTYFRCQNHSYLPSDQPFIDRDVRPTPRGEIPRRFSLYFAAVIFAISLRYLSAVKAGNSTGFERLRRCALLIIEAGHRKQGKGLN